MSKRDYAAKVGKKKKKSSNKTLLVFIAGVIILIFVAGLYFLKQETQPTKQAVVQPEKAKPQRQLPNRPEETWSYIKELENRRVINSSVQLSESQKVELKRLEQDKKAVLEKLKRQQVKNSKFGLLCGIFDQLDEAESLQAHLLMLGLNAKVMESEKGMQVVVGPIANRTIAIEAQQQASDATNCSIVNM